MTTWNELIEGSLYFRFGYSEPEFLNPNIEPMIYLGKDIIESTDNEPLHYFQDCDSYLQRGAFPNMSPKHPGTEDAVIIEYSANDTCRMKSTKELADELNACEERWRLRAQSD